MTPPVIALTDNDVPLAGRIAAGLETACKQPELHVFPDGETRLRINPEDAAATVLVVCSLDHPDPKTVPLLFLSRTLREYGTQKVLLIAPYLAYMRQDRRFREGEGVSARYYAGLLSNDFDGLVTVDAHLHRIGTLTEIYTVPAVNAAAAPAVADWIAANIQRPLLVGPDSESAQWVSAVAGRSDLPYVVLEKQRRGDRDVAITVPDLERWRGNTPVLVDDIISTGASMAATIRQLGRLGLAPPVCIGVHGLFADGAEQALLDAGAGRVVSCNTVRHSSNGIDVSAAVCEGARALLDSL